jgi:hypothetical protein
MLKKFNEFKINEKMGMSVEPDPFYVQFNLEKDGIEPGRDANGHQTLLDGQRRVAWVDRSGVCGGTYNGTHDDYVDEMGKLGLGVIKLCDITDDVGKAKISSLSKNSSEKWSTDLVDNEYLAYLPEYEDQAKLAHKELRRRGGWWLQTEPEPDIYLARLMGYGEEYIVPYIRKYHPNFDVESYIEENPRNKVIK